MNFRLNEDGSVEKITEDPQNPIDYFNEYINGVKKDERIIQITGNNRKTDSFQIDKEMIRVRYFDLSTEHKYRGQNVESDIAVNSGEMLSRLVYGRNKPVSLTPDRQLFYKVWKLKGISIFRGTLNALKIYREDRDILPFAKTFIETYSEDIGLKTFFQCQFGFFPTPEEK